MDMEINASQPGDRQPKMRMSEHRTLENTQIRHFEPNNVMKYKIKSVIHL